MHIFRPHRTDQVDHKSKVIHGGNEVVGAPPLVGTFKLSTSEMCGNPDRGSSSPPCLCNSTLRYLRISEYHVCKSSLVKSRSTVLCGRFGGDGGDKPTINRDCGGEGTGNWEGTRNCAGRLNA